MEPKLTEDELIDILNGESGRISSTDRIYEGLQIIKRYLPGEMAIESAGHDQIFSVQASTLANAGITKADAERLRDLGWFEDYGGLSHHV